MVRTKQATIEDLEALPDDGHVYELIDGALVRREPVGGSHGALQGKALQRIRNFVEEQGLGEVFGADTIFAFQHDPDRGLKPDVSFVRVDRLPVGKEFDKPFEIVPDLVVEVISPNDRASTIEEKIETYRRFGVPLIWVFWPRRRAITVYEAGKPTREREEDDELDGGDVLPGFRIAVSDLFRVGR